MRCFISGIRGPIFMFSSQVEVLQAADEPDRLLGHHSLLLGPLPQQPRGHSDHRKGRKDRSADSRHAYLTHLQTRSALCRIAKSPLHFASGVQRTWTFDHPGGNRHSHLFQSRLFRRKGGQTRRFRLER